MNAQTIPWPCCSVWRTFFGADPILEEVLEKRQPNGNQQTMKSQKEERT
jgi:hypothetical protein